MAYHSRNKNELLALTGAVYSFVAYLTAFTLEVLFIIDLVKQSEYPYSQNGQILSSGAPIPQKVASMSPLVGALEQARSGLESAQSYVAIPCLALSILYFVTFITSLVLIVGLILRSTFFLLIWICIMATLCLPELGLVVYVSSYAWGIETRNGQTELLFYLIRLGLNIIFIHRTYRLFKLWTDEKNFFMLKSGSRFSSVGGYDSPYFVGDSLTTTINPVFSSSTLNLSPYDQARANASNSPMFSTSRTLSSSTDFYNNKSRHNIETRTSSSNLNEIVTPESQRYGSRNDQLDSRNQRNFQQPDRRPRSKMSRPSSMLFNPDYHESYNNHRNHDNEISDDFIDEFEMDLDYRTLTNQQHYFADEGTNEHASTYSQHQRGSTIGSVASPGGLSYSTQSLDRRHLRDMDYAMPEQVILRPLGHQPFEYLHRPGSTSNLAQNSHTNINTQPFGHQTKESRNRYT